MNIRELEELASSIRKTLIETISKTGGHLASNLGVVELTIALHYVFNSPKDLIFYDVSHQSYVHKLLTGRADDFDKLRQFGGISGFTSRNESEHDIFEAGHSSTSISAALGYLAVKENNPTIFDNAVVVIGDASVVNGLAMEAINYLGSKPNQKMIIILNDNEMGISKNVGGIARTFNKIRVRGHFKLLRKITPKSVKMLMKSLAYKNNFLSGLGIKYLGVIDGHNLKDLIEYLEYAKKSPNSVVIHVKTKKGKGYKFAEEDKTGVWHSIPPFDIDSGMPQVKKDESLIFGECLSSYLSKYCLMYPHRVKVITPGMSYGSGLELFQNTNPSDFIDVGIAEESAVIMATAMSAANVIPIMFVYSTFLQRAYDELIHDFARNNSHGIICVDRAGIVDGDGPTHQGIYDIAYLSTIPNLKILAPYNCEQAVKMLEYALTNPSPYVIRYPKEAISKSFSNIIKESKWEIVKESENNKYIITYGPNLDKFLKILTNKKIGLINALWIKPYDKELLTNLLKNNVQLYFYEEVVANNSLGKQVIDYANTLYQNKQITMFNIKVKTLPDEYLVVGKTSQLLDKYDMNMEKYIEKVEED